MANWYVSREAVWYLLFNFGWYWDIFDVEIIFCAFAWLVPINDKCSLIEWFIQDLSGATLSQVTCSYIRQSTSMLAPNGSIRSIILHVVMDIPITGSYLMPVRWYQLFICTQVTLWQMICVSGTCDVYILVHLCMFQWMACLL